MSYKQLQRKERIIIETMLNEGHSISSIARYLGYNKSAISREVKKGLYTHRNHDWTETVKYSSDLAQQRADYMKTSKGRPLKIGSNKKLADFLEEKVIKDKLSPEAALESAKDYFPKEELISVPTLYKYIDKKVFFKLSNKNLPIKSKKKKRPKQESCKESFCWNFD